MTAKVAGMVLQKFVHLAARDADLVKIVRVVTNGALIFIVMIAIVLIVMIAIVLILMIPIVLIVMIPIMMLVMPRG
jgi:hypothetical protein